MLGLMVPKSQKKMEFLLPVAQQGAQQHQAVLHAGDDFRGAVSTQKEFSAGFKAAKCECFGVPLINHLLQLLLNVSLFYSTDTDVLLKWQALILSPERHTSFSDSLCSTEVSSSLCFICAHKYSYSQN